MLANARSRVCFQLAGEDAQVMARSAGDLLRPDMGAKVTFLPSGAAQAAAPAHPLPRVTTRAIVTGADGIRRAWVVDKETVHPVRVEVAREDGGMAEIRSGLSGGETVVADPPSDLSEGRRVHVKS